MSYDSGCRTDVVINQCLEFEHTGDACVDRQHAYMPPVVCADGHRDRDHYPTADLFKGIPADMHHHVPSDPVVLGKQHIQQRSVGLISAFFSFVLQFSSRWYLCARKSPYAPYPVYQKFPHIALETVPICV